jgi:hypothetical protein
MGKKYYLLLVFAVASKLACSQNDTASVNHKLCEIQLHDGSVYHGYIQRQTDSLIYLKSNGDVLIQIPKRNITSIEALKAHAEHDTTGLKIRTPSIGMNYYTTSSAAFLFHKGDIYGSDSYLAFFSVNYAMTRNVSLGVVSSVIGVPMGAHVQANIEVSHKLYLGVEGIVGSLMYLNPKTYGTGGIGKLTYGDFRRHFTFYAGYFDGEQWIQPRRPRRGRPGRPGDYYMSYRSSFAGIAASLPISAKTHFVADFFAFPFVQVYTGSFGLRGVSKKNFSFEGGFQLIRNIFPLVNRTFTVPYLGFAYRL